MNQNSPSVFVSVSFLLFKEKRKNKQKETTATSFSVVGAQLEPAGSCTQESSTHNSSELFCWLSPGDSQKQAKREGMRSLMEMEEMKRS